MREMGKIQVTILENGNRRLLETEKGSSLFEILKSEGLFPASHCGGKGICGRCKVRFLKGVMLPKAGDRAVFSPEELRNGFRLACLSKPSQNCEIELLFPRGEQRIKVVTSVMETENVEGQTPIKNRGAIIAIDLGTTTIAMELRDALTGQLYDSFCELNPQREYGADVISRIHAANQGEGKRLQQLVKSTLEKGIHQLVASAENEILCKPERFCLACNTAMGQILMGYSVEKLGRYPFLPENIQRQQISLGGMKGILMPGLSAFVGGDILAGLHYVKKKQGGFCGKEPTLFIDLGTNGEMALGNENRILVTATAAGPAFEGGSESNLMGADLIACLDELKGRGILDETGLLKEPWLEEGIQIGQAILTGKDVRALQMAKAAVCAGICILIENYGIGIEELKAVYLAGGFGYFLNVDSAISLGVIPKELQGKVQAVGNTALAGAFLYGRDWPKEDGPEGLVHICESVNLAEEGRFLNLYMNAMALKPLSYKEMIDNIEESP